MTLTRPVLALLALTACDNVPPPSTPSPPPWICPASWVTTSRGGCAPDERWPQIAEPAGVPASDWRPVVGVSRCVEGQSRDPDGACHPSTIVCAESAERLPNGTCVPRESLCADFPEPDGAPPAEAVAYVRESAAREGADGSRAHPFADIASALARGPGVRWVLLAPGTYRERVSLTDRDVHLRGACSSRTVLIAPTGGLGPTVHVQGDSAHLAIDWLAVRGGVIGVEALGGASLELSHLRVESTTRAGVYVDAASAALTDVLIRDVSEDSGGLNGLGLRAEDGAHVTLRDVAIARACALGISVLGRGTLLEGRGVSVREMRPSERDLHPHAGEAAAPAAFGARAIDGAALRLSEVTVSRTYEGAVLSIGAGSQVELEDAIIEETLAPDRLHPDEGRALNADVNATLVARRVTVRSVAGTCVFAGDSASITIEEGYLRGASLAGAIVSTGATMTLAGVALESNHVSGLVVERRATANVRELLVRGSLPDLDGARGRGVEAVSGGVIVGAGVMLESDRDVALAAVDDGSRLEIDRLLVRGTLPRAEDIGGNALAVVRGATARITRARFDSNRDVAVHASDERTALTLTDAIVEDTQAGLTGIGRGLNVQDGAHATLESVAARGCVEAGVVARGAGTLVTLTDVTVSDVAIRPNNGGGGLGLVATEGAHVDAERLHVQRVPLEAVMAWRDATITLRDALLEEVSGASEGFGIGLLAADDGHLVADRVAVRSCAGAAVAAVSFARAVRVGGASVSARDLFVEGVRPSNVDDDSRTEAPGAYGIFVGPECAFEVERATIVDADWGFFHSAGALTFRRGLVALQRRGAGALNLVDARHPALLDALTLRDNASNAIAHDIDLPTLRLAPPPEPRLTP